MGLFSKVFGKEETLTALSIDDSAIVAMADGRLIDVAEVSDPVFAEKMLGESIAFRYSGDKVTLCSPANGKLTVLFPTGHAFGVTMNNGVELLVHCGVDTVKAKGDGFRLFKKQGDSVRAGEPVVEADLRKLSRKYDMSTMLIITDPADQEIQFIPAQDVKRGQSVIQ